MLSRAAPAPAQEAGGDGVQSDRDRETRGITFFGHVFGHSVDQPMPANTQFPEGEDNYGAGSTIACVAPATAPDCENDPAAYLVLYSSPGFVQITDGTEWEAKGRYAALHNEHGNTKDIILDETRSATASIYLTLDTFGWYMNTGETGCMYPNPRDTGCLYPYWGWDPGAWPDFVVKASLYHATLGEYGSAASDQPQIRPALEGGQATLVAEGRTHTPLVTNGIPGNPNVHEYVVDLGAPQVDRIPKEDDIFIVYRFYHETSGTQWNTGAFRIWSGEFFPVRFTLPMKNAFDVEKVVPQFIHERLAILATLNTPWGSYDINPDATRLTITDERGNEIVPQRLEVLADYKVAHGAHYKPVNVTFIWDYRADNLPPGEYAVAVAGANHQRSATADCSARFAIGPEGHPEAAQAGVCGQQTGLAFQGRVGTRREPRPPPGAPSSDACPTAPS